MRSHDSTNGPMASQSGFTLLEMVVAVTIVAMMSVVLWSVFRIALTSWTRGTEIIDFSQRERNINDMMHKQVASIYGLTAPATLQTGGALYPIFSGASDSVQFISLSSFRFMDNPGLTMVSYDVVEDVAGTYTLVEREAQFLGLDPGRESVFDREEESLVPLFEHLTNFSFEYFDEGGINRPAGWLPEWDAQSMGVLPRAISMSMESLEGGNPVARRIVIPIMAKTYDRRLSFQNPFESRPRRFAEDDPRRNR